MSPLARRSGGKREEEREGGRERGRNFGREREDERREGGYGRERKG